MRKLFHCAFALAFTALFVFSLAACSDDNGNDFDPNTEWEISMTVNLPKADTVTLSLLTQWDDVPIEDWEMPVFYWEDPNQSDGTVPKHYYEAGQHTFIIRGKGRVIVECPGIHLVSIDARQCPVLYNLYCEDNDLTELLLGEQRELTYLWCDSNQLASLKLSSCQKLKSLKCSNNNLSSLNLIRNMNLEEIYCNDNPLTSFSLGTLFNINTLVMHGNLLSAEAYDEVFSSLPGKTDKEPGTIVIDRDCGDISILEKKHWQVQYPDFQSNSSE